MEYDDFDLFLVDMAMPRMGGFELMKMIKKKQPFAVIIILTGFPSIEDAVRTIRAGAFHYITKPTNAEELLEVVKKGLEYSEDLYGPLQKVFEPLSETVHKRGPIILHGFSPEDKTDFLSLGSLCEYDVGVNIPIGDKKSGSIILVDRGEVSVWLNNTIVDYLQKWDTYGEERLILAESLITKLRAETAVRVRYFDRKKMLDFFAYKGEKLMKRFMINLINCTFSKWRKSIQRIVMLKLVTGEK